jgi:3-oxoacyl-[acyl-carrier-protein] synthase III
VTARTTAPPLDVGIVGLGAYLPSRIVTNDDLAAALDTSDAWIRTRTGIAQRHVAGPEQATSDLAATAGKAALADAGLGADDVASVVVATTTPDHLVPGTAPLVAAALGTHAGAFDVNAACSGFVYGLKVGAALAAADDRPVLVIGAETLTRIVDPTDRSVAVLFGDGAGAAVLAPGGGSLGPFVLGVDGSDPSMLWTRSGGTREPTTPATLEARSQYLTMRGGDVYRHAVVRMAGAATDVLAQAGLEPDDIDLFVGHQANARILDAVRQRVGIAADRALVTVDQHGNTAAASIPLALASAREQGSLRPGDTVLLAAFGAGLSWGACLLTWTGAAVRPDAHRVASIGHDHHHSSEVPT